MIDFAIPGLHTHNNLNYALLNMMQKNPEFFYDNVSVAAVYGLFPFCIWDGGRIYPQYKHATVEDMEATANELESRKIPLRLILTNNQLQEKDYYDKFGNVMLRICERPGNQIVVGDDKFGDYIRTNYPKYSFISSTTKCLKKSDFVEELEKPQYIETCLDYNLNHNFSMLDELSQEQKDKCEFLINAICPPGCPSRKDHYRLNSLFYLGYARNYRVPKCNIQGGTLDPKTVGYSNNIQIDSIFEDYESRGFKHFKLEGRTLDNSELIGNYVRYMVKPEYQIYVYNELVKITLKED